MEALKMERQMDNWNDARPDELNRRVDEGFKKVDEGFKEVDKRSEQVDKRFEQVDKRFEQVDKRFDKCATKEELGEVKGAVLRLNDKFDRLYNLLLVGMGSLSITLLGYIVTHA